MIPLTGTSTGAAGKAGPNLQAYYDRKAEEEAKRKALEGETESSKGGKAKLKSTIKRIFRPMGYSKEEWEGK